MKNMIVVIGAGVSGLLLARTLKERGARVLVLEKSRGVGGRMSTRRSGEAVFDQGAQFFTVHDPRLAALVSEWESEQAVARWDSENHPRWIARPSMTGLAKLLARNLPIKLGHNATAVSRHGCGCWEIDVEGEGMVRAERVVLTAPMPQSLALLRAGNTVLPESVGRRLAACEYRPCLALMLTLDRPSAVPATGVRFDAGPLRWIADNVAKGIAQGAPGALTVHLAPEYSEHGYGWSELALFEAVLPALRPWLGEAVVTARAVHRWRYSELIDPVDAPYIWLEEERLGFCGDAFGGARVEFAALSGLALAECIGRTLETGTGAA